VPESTTEMSNEPVTVRDFECEVRPTNQQGEPASVGDILLDKR
jgi:hypothetical protein